MDLFVREFDQENCEDYTTVLSFEKFAKKYHKIIQKTSFKDGQLTSLKSELKTQEKTFFEYCEKTMDKELLEDFKSRPEIFGLIETDHY